MTAGNDLVDLFFSQLRTVIIYNNYDGSSIITRELRQFIDDIAKKITIDSHVNWAQKPL